MEGAIVAVPKQRPQPAVVGKFRAVWMSPHCQWLINGNTGEMVTKEEDGFCYTVISDLDDTCNYYYKQRYIVGEDGIPTAVLQDDEADDDQEAIKCYKIFEVQKMIREDGSHFMFNLNTRQSVPANVSIVRGQHTSLHCSHHCTSLFVSTRELLQLEQLHTSSRLSRVWITLMRSGRRARRFL